MAVSKLLKNRYEKEEDVEALFQFVADPLRYDQLVCGGCNIVGTVLGDPDNIAEQFLIVQRDRVCQRRVYHLIISFDPVLDKIDLQFADQVGKAICAIYPEYQSVYVLHDDTDYLHIHIVYNNVPLSRDCCCLSEKISKVKIDERLDELIDRHLGM